MKIGGFLKERRREAGLTTRVLGEKAGVSWSYVAALERGKYSPTLPVLHRLLKALDVGWVEFLTATGYIKKEK
ncbi:MAG: helix-turn-helix transcriptional regulator [Deltaproteobacteria bacterium]|nr:helix-turn-helix transcriptional regulator [Deltaproteobacteria bacterium]